MFKAEVMPLEYRLVTKVILDKDFSSLEKAQITEEYFNTADCLAVYRYLRETFYNPITAGQVPSIELVKERFPTFVEASNNDTVGILAQELRKEKVRLEVLRLTQTLQSEVDSDPLAAVASLRTGAIKIASLSEVGDDMSLSSAYTFLLSNYDMVQKSGGILGVPYPWPALNTETQGKQGGQFIVLYGRPKSQKSFLAIYMAAYDYIYSRRRVLFYTREMNPALVAQRLAATVAEVDYKAFKNGTLQPHIKDQAFTVLKELIDDEKAMGAMTTNQPGFLIVSDRGGAGSEGGGGVGWLASKIRDFRPHVVYVDGMYLMKDDRSNSRTVDWKAISHISKDLKLTAQEFNIPIIGITQANRTADKSIGTDLTELAFTDSLGQDADAVFRVSRHDTVDEQGIKRTELWLTAPGLREGEFGGMVIGGEPCFDYKFKRMLTSKDSEDEASKHSKKPHEATKPSYNKTFGADPKIPMKALK